MSRRDQEWFDYVFGYTASIVADIRERVLFDGWFGHKPGTAKPPNVENIYTANFYGDSIRPEGSSVGEVEPYDRVLREKLHADAPMETAYGNAFSPPPAPGPKPDDPTRDIGIDR